MKERSKKQHPDKIVIKRFLIEQQKNYLQKISARFFAHTESALRATRDLYFCVADIIIVFLGDVEMIY